MLAANGYIFSIILPFVEDFGYFTKVAFLIWIIYSNYQVAHGKQALTMSMGFLVVMRQVWLATRIVDSPGSG